MELLGSFGDIGLSLGFTIIAFLFVLTIIVFIHEMGHFLAARWCGVAVSTFSIGFGPELAGFNDRKGTRWKISAIPLDFIVADADVHSEPGTGARSLDAPNGAGQPDRADATQSGSSQINDAKRPVTPSRR